MAVRLGAAALCGIALLSSLVHAHEHHEDNIPEGEVVSPEPLDSILWMHIIIQILGWGIVFPTGMVLGIVKSKWHVPVQTVGTLLALTGYFMGHKHGGRQFTHNVHSSYAPWLGWMLTAQIGLGIYLKLHLERFAKFFGKSRWPFVLAHGIIGKALPVASWVQMLFGGITAMGYCRDDHLGQCLAHFIMGSAFIAYGIILTLLLLVGQAWIIRSGRSQEFFDSIVIAAWGCVNTFTEHRWGGPWVANDLQHTSMGVVWWCAGLLGVWLSRKRNGQPKRNLWPAMILIMTGWAMGSHPQHSHLSTGVHTTFGYTLMAAGGARVIEISFLLKDQSTLDVRYPEEANSFQHVTPFLLYAAGFLFMGATEEQMAFLGSKNVTHVSYILLLYSIAFLLYLFVCMLLNMYANYTWPLDPKTGQPLDSSDAETGRTGRRSARMTSREIRENRQVADAEEFELTGLISEDEDTAEGSEGSTSSERVRRKEASLS